MLMNSEARSCASSDLAAGAGFRREVDAFLEEALTEDLRAAGRATTGLKSAPEACRIWREKLSARGWFAPSWPVHFGGAGWSTAQRLYFESACAQRDAPILQSSGVRTIGPLIIAEGSATQKAYYLPRILSGEHEWCQGFSEAAAGSDLTALSMRAGREGDEFILDGQKLWTSFAQYATHMFLLARCDPASKGPNGLVFLLVDMNLSGISVRPIRFLDGEYETNQVFFDRVRTPVADRIGAIGEGWKSARRLMAIARGNNTTTGVLRRALRSVTLYPETQTAAEPSLRTALAEISMRLDAFEALESRTGAGQFSLDEAPASSALKLIATELHQAITQLGLSLAPGTQHAQSKYLATRAATIYSGTSEIHRNGLAKAIGCP